MLVMRLQRIGRKNDPSFRVVVTPKERSSKAGRFIEAVGFYNAREKKAELNGERIQHWLSQGVQPSGTVHNLLVTKKIVAGDKTHVSRSSRKKAVAAEAPKA